MPIATADSSRPGGNHSPVRPARRGRQFDKLVPFPKCGPAAGADNLAAGDFFVDPDNSDSRPAQAEVALPEFWRARDHRAPRPRDRPPRPWHGSWCACRPGGMDGIHGPGEVPGAACRPDRLGGYPRPPSSHQRHRPRDRTPPSSMAMQMAGRGAYDGR